MSIFQKATKWIFERKDVSLTKLQPRPDAHIGAGPAGIVVTPSSALGLSAVYACTRLYAGTIAGLPLQVLRGERGSRVVFKEHPLYPILHDSPNYDQTSFNALDMMVTSLELRGNAYAAKKFGSQGQIIALRPIHPDAMSVRRLASGEIEYRWTENGKYYVGTDRDVLHIRGAGGDALGGVSVLSVARNAISAAIAAETAAAATFANGMRPSMVIQYKDFLSPANREAANGAMMDKYSGALNAGKPFILEGGEVKNVSISPEDAQMIETRGFGVEEICRFFGVPPVMVGHAGAATAWPTSAEQQGLIFQRFSLKPRLECIEQAMNQQLLTPEDRANGVVIEFNIEGLLRGDSAARSAFYAQGLQNGYFTINEVRAWENLPPVTGGDIPRMQMQNIPITQAGIEQSEIANGN